MTEQTIIKISGLTDINAMVLDVVLSETLVSASEVTTLPTQKGFDYNDHIIHAPKAFRVTSVFGFYPIAINAPANNAEGVNMLGDSLSYVDRVWNDQSNRFESLYQQIEAIKNSNTPFVLTTAFGRFEDVILRNYEISKDKDTVIDISFDLLQLNILTLENTQQINTFLSNTTQLQGRDTGGRDTDADGGTTDNNINTTGTQVSETFLKKIVDLDLLSGHSASGF